jgi:hypothetical protein
MELLHQSPAESKSSSQKQLCCSSNTSQPPPIPKISTPSPAVTDQPHPTSTTTSPASTHAALDQHQQQLDPQTAVLKHQQQQQAPEQQKPQPQQMKLRRLLRGDVTKSYIMRPGSSSWTAVTQVYLQQAPAQSHPSMEHAAARVAVTWSGRAAAGVRGLLVGEDC